MKPIDMAPYRDAVQERICSFCIDSREDGTCRRPEDEPCALMSHLEQIVQAVIHQRVTADIDAYVRGLRKEVCPTCQQDAAGHCELRWLAECAADSYIVPVVDVIEEVARARGDLKT